MKNVCFIIDMPVPYIIPILLIAHLDQTFLFKSVNLAILDFVILWIYTYSIVKAMNL